jgi:hypothetical protein
MQWLTLIPESANARRLSADTRRPATARSVDATARTPAPQPATDGEHLPESPQPAGERRRAERRCGEERRRRQQPVLLDTRCSHDRRQPSADEARRPTARKRINLYA